MLLGPGAVDAVLPWDGPEVAALLAGNTTSGPVARALGEADAVICYSRSAPLLEAVAARARRVIRHDPSPPPMGPHAARWLTQAVAPLLGGCPASPQDEGVLEFTEEERRHAQTATRELPEGFVAVHPGSGSPAKNWPLTRFVDAARALADGQRWLLVTGPAERGVDVPSDAVLARDWPLRLLGAALARALVFLGNDAGVSHLAAAAGAPTLALFGPTDPALWAPVGLRVKTLRAPHGSLALLELEAVLAAARALKSAASGPPSG
ncbi:MAG TPA: glycosyltransferase family 9 protein [Vicinamibacteria bacterium]